MRVINSVSAACASACNLWNPFRHMAQFPLDGVNVLIHLNKKLRLILGTSKCYTDSCEKVFLTAPNTFYEHSFYSTPFL